MAVLLAIAYGACGPAPPKCAPTPKAFAYKNRLDYNNRSVVACPMCFGCRFQKIFDPNTHSRWPNRVKGSYESHLSCDYVFASMLNDYYDSSICLMSEIVKFPIKVFLWCIMNINIFNFRSRKMLEINKE